MHGSSISSITLCLGGFPGGAFAQSQGCSLPHAFGNTPLWLSALHYPKTPANEARPAAARLDSMPTRKGAQPSEPQEGERGGGRLAESTPLPQPAPHKAQPKPPLGRGGCTASTPVHKPPPHRPLPLSLPLNSLSAQSSQTISPRAAFVSLQPQKKNDGFELLTPPQKKAGIKRGL